VRSTDRPLSLRAIQSPIEFKKQCFVEQGPTSKILSNLIQTTHCEPSSRFSYPAPSTIAHQQLNRPPPPPPCCDLRHLQKGGYQRLSICRVCVSLAGRNELLRREQSADHGCGHHSFRIGTSFSSCNSSLDCFPKAQSQCNLLSIQGGAAIRPFCILDDTEPSTLIGSALFTLRVCHRIQDFLRHSFRPRRTSQP
jgi:hypothetical protein